MPVDLLHHCRVTTRSATALYVGAVLGPGVLLIPALAAEAAGPASIVAWAALLPPTRGPRSAAAPRPRPAGCSSPAW
jgi:hypothetical protein